MRGKLLVLGSFVAAGAAVGNAFYQKRQFYEAVVFLTQSSISMLCVYWLAATLAFLFAHLLQLVFFGKLNPREVEHLHDRAWFAITETCLAMTIFRDDFSTTFAVLFGVLLAMKIAHWLAQDRVDFMEQTRNLSWLFHFRMVSVVVALGAVDAYMVHFAAQSLLKSGLSMQLLFGFEYVVLAALITTTFFKYILQSLDLRSEQPWENKTVYMFYLDLLSDFIRLVVYLGFFITLVNYYTIPLHIIRDLLTTFRSFVRRLNDLILMRQVTANMDQRYPDATPEELAAADNTCIICREEMLRAKKLPCGHMFHIRCLRSWLERQRTCPTCRANVLDLVAAQAREEQAAARARALANPPMAPNMAPPMPWPPAWQPPPGFVAPGAGAGAAPPVGDAAGPAAAAAAPGTPQAPPAPGTPGAAGFPGTPFTPLGFPGPFPGMFPPMPPPPMFVPFDFAAMPMDEDLEGLSADELRQMEGTERQQVIQRVVFLRKFRSQLDAMLSRFGQYESITRDIAFPEPGASTAGDGASASASASAADGGGASADAAAGDAAAAAATPGLEVSATATNPATTAQPASGGGSSEGSNASADEAMLSPAERLRQRRVRHFSERSQPDENTAADE
eukprot:m.352788 g.352788  ORF g.352788 m.352788 type:complete len:619 (+) comp19903_c22_seq7:157-2013(+)